MEIASFVSLFKSYCENYQYEQNGRKKTLHFLHFDVEELLNSLKDIKFPAFFLTTPDVDFEGANIDELSESYEATFMILLQLENNNIFKKAVTIDTAKSIADNFIRRMIYDIATHDILDGLNIAGIKSSSIVRTADNLFGWQVSFNLVQAFDGEIQQDKWLDLNSEII